MVPKSIRPEKRHMLLIIIEGRILGKLHKNTTSITSSMTLYVTFPQEILARKTKLDHCIWEQTTTKTSISEVAEKRFCAAPVQEPWNYNYIFPKADIVVNKLARRPCKLSRDNCPVDAECCKPVRIRTNWGEQKTHWKRKACQCYIKYLLEQ